MKTTFRVRNLEKVQKYLLSLPRGVVRVALAALSEYLLGNEQHGLKHSDPYKYVSRKSAYGVTFFTEKQRRWFWANGGPDMIGNNRTGESSKAWRAEPRNDGYRYTLINETRAAYYTRNDYGQARQPAKVGWRKVSQVVKDNLAGAFRHAMAAVNKYLKEKK